jgi:hypothetical protein
MWTYKQSDGQIQDFKGFRFGCSYAGRGEGKNNPVLQDVHAGTRWDADTKLWLPVDGLTPEDCGPLCCGIYTMQAPVDTEKHGPFVLWLTPDPNNEMFGRSEFGIHGDAIEHPGLASEGCICSPRIIRGTMWRSNDHKLQVIP